MKLIIAFFALIGGCVLVLVASFCVLAFLGLCMAIYLDWVTQYCDESTTELAEPTSSPTGVWESKEGQTEFAIDLVESIKESD